MSDRNEFAAALRSLRPVIAAIFVMGFFSTLLYFTIPLYTLQIFERVSTSHNVNTLFALTVIAVFLVTVDAALNQLKEAMLQRAAVALDRRLAGPLFDHVHRSIVASDRSTDQARLTDLDTIRSFLSGPVLTSITQVVYFPLFVILLFILHPAFAGLVLVGLVIVLTLTWFSRYSAEASNKHANEAQAHANELSTSLFRSYEVVQALGMRGNLRRLWLGPHNDAMGWSMAASRRSSVFNGLLEVTRSLMQMGVYALGGYLIIGGHFSMGVLMAASMIVGKAFSPVQGIIANWRQVATVRESYRKLNALFEETGIREAKLELPKPTGRLTVEGVSIAPPGKTLGDAVLSGVTFDLPAGVILAIIGPSAAGKTTLLKAVVGVWRPVLGEIRIDGSTLDQWDDELLGRYIGYLPAEVDLFPGTVADNIRRFSDAPDGDVVEAAKRARVYEMIMQLPQGFGTMITNRGTGLSSGQRQRIGLARALFGDPRLIVLDEPNANLDAAGEENLMQALRSMRNEGRTIIFVTHKVSLVQAADYVLVVGAGGQREFGPRDRIMQKMTEPRVVAGTSVKSA